MLAAAKVGLVEYTCNSKLVKKIGLFLHKVMVTFDGY